MLTPSTMIRSPRNRVHDMLRTMRNDRYSKQATDTFSDVKHDNSLALRHVPQYGGGNDSVNPKQRQAYIIFIFVLIVIVLTIVFVYVGQWVDAELNNYQKKHRSTSALTLILIQMIFNVAILCVPYCVVCNYNPDSLICHYYLVVAAFWVVALHAQTHLKERFQNLFQSNTHSTNASTTKKENDALIIDSLVKGAIQKQMSKPSSQNSTYPTLQQQTPERHIPISTRQHSYHSMHDTPPTTMAATEHFNTPVQFNSQDLLPTFPPQERATNIADLF